MSNNITATEDTRILQTLNLLQYKVKKMKRIRTFLFIGAILTMLMSFVVSDISTLFAVLSIGLIITALVFTFRMASARNEVKAYISDNVVKACLDEVFDLDYYAHAKHIPENSISEAGLIDDWDECFGSDHFTGKYKNINIECSDIELIEVRKEKDPETDDEHEVRTTKFKGVWMICDFNKKLSAKLWINERKKSLLGKYVKNKSNIDIETENQAFNDQFHVRSFDGHTAFYVLTPQFMEKIMKTDMKSKGETNLFFNEGKVHIAIHNNRDSFEVSHKDKGLKDLNLLRGRFKQEISYLTDIVDELLTNQYFSAE